jgi:hypothetical protein
MDESETKTGYTPYRDRHPVPAAASAFTGAPARMPSDKSVGAALLLTFLFGPLGLFYVSVLAACLMIVVTIFLGIITLGFGLPVAWCACMIWGGVAASNQHSRHQLWFVQQIQQGASGGPAAGTPPQG